MRSVETPMTDAVDIRCPKCGRWLAEASEYGRAVCALCGWEVEVRSRGARDGSGLPHHPQNSTKGR